MSDAGHLGWLAARPVAHRGLHDAAAGVVENSLAAADAAVAGGFAIEVDVQPAADLEPVVFHDDTLERLTIGRGPVGAMTAHELAALPFRESDARIPRLVDLLALVDGRVPLFVEIKSDFGDIAPFCARVVEAARNYGGPLALMSFDPSAVAAVRRAAPHIARGIVAESFRSWRPKRTGATQRIVMRRLLHLPCTRPHFIAYCVDDLPAAGPAAIRAMTGMPLLAWTVRTDEQRRRAARWADQVIFEGFRP